MGLDNPFFRACIFLLLAPLVNSCNGSGSNNNDDDDSEDPPPEPRSSARQVDSSDDLLEGPLARGRSGDFVLENDLLRVIIQQPGREWFGMGTYGGNIIDASARLEDGGFNPDHLEEFITGINIENTANYTEVAVRNDGADGEPAVICASGPDDLVEILNASSQIRQLGVEFPESADDRDLPVEVETCYSLAPEESWVTIDTTLRNTSAELLPIFMVEYLNGSGEVEAFQPGAGFGEPLFTPACPEETRVACSGGECDQCNYLAYTGNSGGAGVSYGFIHEVPGSSSFSSFGVTALVLGLAVTDLLFNSAPPNFEIPAEGEITLRRYFAVGDGTASSIADIRNRIQGIGTGQLSGTVSSAGQPLPHASVSVFQTRAIEIEPPARFMAGNARTDAEGRYSMSLPPGDYEVQAYAEGYLYASDEPVAVSVVEDEESSQDFDMPEPGYLHVDVTEIVIDGRDRSAPAKMQLVGIDPSPPLRNSVPPFQTGVFVDNADPVPYGVTAVDFIDRDGSSEVLAIEPGDYQVVVSRGPRYSAYRQDITIRAGRTTEVRAEIAQVVETPGFVSADFHVHAIDSVDSEVTREERVATYIAEGMDFFTPSEHSLRADFTQTLLDMDVADLIDTASNAEITPFDYGHFNSWPVTIDSSRIGGGSVDWGREAPPGQDFPEYGSYGLPPAEIFDTALADPLENIVQINHIASHFGPAGLSIDTGLTPPQSFTDLSELRLDPNIENAFDDSFHSLEVWIGTDGRNGIFNQFLGQNLGDWFNLINQDLVRTGVANSDTHSRRNTYLSARSLVASAVTEPGRLSERAEQLAATVAEGKVTGTNGPFITINASATFAGVTRTAGLGVSDRTTIPVSPGTPAVITVTLSTPSWAAVDTVDFYVNNQPELTSGEGEASRYGVCANFTVTAGDRRWEEREIQVIDGLEGASRRDITVTLTLPSVVEDSWVMAIAHGTDGESPPMFPVVPEDLDRASNQTLEDLTDDNLGEGGVLAYAFTNPLFLDVGANGWEAPGVMNEPCSE